MGRGRTASIGGAETRENARLDFQTTGDNDASMRALHRVAIGASVFATTAAQSQDVVVTPRATVSGVVTNVARRPLVGAEVRLVADTGLREQPQAGGVRTGEQGQFVLSGGVAPRNWLRVTLTGYEPEAVELFFPRDSMRPLVIELERSATDSGRSENRDSSLDDRQLSEFVERRRSNAMGHFYTRKDIVARQPQYLSELLRNLPGVVVSASRSGGYALRMRGCRYAPVIWIDRTRAEGIELDEVARVDEVAALEVYTGPSGVPAQYLDRSNVGCGTILVWSRN